MLQRSYFEGLFKGHDIVVLNNQSMLFISDCTNKSRYSFRNHYQSKRAEMDLVWKPIFFSTIKDASKVFFFMSRTFRVDSCNILFQEFQSEKAAPSVHPSLRCLGAAKYTERNSLRKFQVLFPQNIQIP